MLRCHRAFVTQRSTRDIFVGGEKSLSVENKGDLRGSYTKVGTQNAGTGQLVVEHPVSKSIS